MSHENALICNFYPDQTVKFLLQNVLSFKDKTKHDFILTPNDVRRPAVSYQVTMKDPISKDKGHYFDKQLHITTWVTSSLDSVSSLPQLKQLHVFITI